MSSICLQPESIDLGLPSGLKWASFNLGATKPEEVGAVCTWGDIRIQYVPHSKRRCNMLDYKWYSGAKDNEDARYGLISSDIKFKGLSKYNTDSDIGPVDNRTMLGFEDDAAHIHLGDGWRIPAYHEWNELLSLCKWEYYEDDGLFGFSVTGPNGNRIYLPMEDDPQMWAIAYYWCTNLYFERPDCAFIFSIRKYKKEMRLSYNNRSFPSFIRAVRD